MILKLLLLRPRSLRRSPLVVRITCLQWNANSLRANWQAECMQMCKGRVPEQSPMCGRMLSGRPGEEPESDHTGLR